MKNNVLQVAVTGQTASDFSWRDIDPARSSAKYAAKPIDPDQPERVLAMVSKR